MSKTGLQRVREFFDRDSTIGYLFITPIIIIVLGLITYPFLNALYLSMTQKFVGYPPKFVFLQNYIELFYDGFFRRTVRNSFVYTFSAVSLKLALGMAMALTLHGRLKIRNLFRGLLLLPWITPTIVIACIWMWMYDGLKGVINIELMRWGLIERHIAWLSGAKTAMFAVITVNVWRGFPFFGISLLAGMQAIPQELYEAAEVDGASAAQRFWHITLPGLRNVIYVTTLLSTIWTFNDFDIVYFLTRGGPGGATQIFATLAYEIGFEGLRWGEAVTVSIYLLPGMAFVIWLISRLLRREE